MIVLPGVTDFGVRSQCGALGGRDGASRPHRLIPYGRNRTFTGRKNHIESLRKLSEPKAHNRIALYGLGGSGKTQIALEYVYQWAGESNGDVYWVRGSGVLNFTEGFKDVAQHIRIPRDGTETDEEGFLKSIRRWFEGPTSGDWILVVDNADDDADFLGNNSPIAKFIPQGTKGTVIFTTRSRQVALRQGCRLIEVGKMGREEAVELFSKRFEDWGQLRDGEKRATAMILDSVHHLPLAVVGLVAFIAETQTPPSLYWAMFQEHEERTKKLLSQQFCDIQREVDVTESILGTYFVTFDRIGQQMPAAADLLRLIAFFDRQNIPEELLRQCGLEGMDDLVEFRRAVGTLLGFSLITIVKCEDKTFYELHRLVQLSLQVYLPTNELSRWRTAALKVVSRLFPPSGNEWLYVGPDYIRHALAVTKGSIDPIAEELGYRMGQYFLDIGSHGNAEIQFRRCISLREGNNGYNWDDDGHERVRHLGLVSAYQGNADAAEKILRNLLEGIEGSPSPNSTHVLRTVGSLAVALQYKGKYKESEAMGRRALEGGEKVLGPDDPDTLKFVNSLAFVLQFRGKYDESEALGRRASGVYEKVFGLDHRDTLTSFNSLAIVLRCQGKYNESEAMNRRVLEGREKVLGPNHLDTLASVNNLATVLQDQGKYDESEAMNRRALEGREKTLAPDHPDILTNINNLAQVLQYQGNYHESEVMNRRALEGREKVLGRNHPNTLSSINNMATVLQRLGRCNESEAMNRRALEGRREVLGPDHPNTLNSVNNLAIVLQCRGNYNESETMNRRALEVREKVLGPDHPDTLVSVSNLATVLQDQGKYDESEAMNRRALEACEKVLVPDHPDTLKCVNNLAAVLQCQGKYNESERQNRRALGAREKVLGPDHPDTLTSADNLAISLQCQGKYGESQAIYRRVRLRTNAKNPPDKTMLSWPPPSTM